jgi:hypothetical protein
MKIFESPFYWQIKRFDIYNYTSRCKVIACTEHFLFQFLKSFHPSGVSETPICFVIKGLQ